MTTLPNNVNFSSFYARSFSSNEMPFEVNSQRLISFFFSSRAHRVYEERKESVA